MTPQSKTAVVPTGNDIIGGPSGSMFDGTYTLDDDPYLVTIGDTVVLDLPGHPDHGRTGVVLAPRIGGMVDIQAGSEVLSWPEQHIWPVGASRGTRAASMDLRLARALHLVNVQSALDVHSAHDVDPVTLTPGERIIDPYSGAPTEVLNVEVVANPFEPSRNDVTITVAGPDGSEIVQHFMQPGQMVKRAAKTPRPGSAYDTTGVADFERQANQSDPFAGVGLKQDDDGWYVSTHRARSDSYPTKEAIPDQAIEFIRSTGSIGGDDNPGWAANEPQGWYLVDSDNLPLTRLQVGLGDPEDSFLFTDAESQSAISAGKASNRMPTATYRVVWAFRHGRNGWWVMPRPSLHAGSKGGTGSLAGTPSDLDNAYPIRNESVGAPGATRTPLTMIASSEDMVARWHALVQEAREDLHRWGTVSDRLKDAISEIEDAMEVAEIPRPAWPTHDPLAVAAHLDGSWGLPCTYTASQEMRAIGRRLCRTSTLDRCPNCEGALADGYSPDGRAWVQCTICGMSMEVDRHTGDEILPPTFATLTAVAVRGMIYARDARVGDRVYSFDPEVGSNRKGHEIIAIEVGHFFAGDANDSLRFTFDRPLSATSPQMGNQASVRAADAIDVQHMRGRTEWVDPTAGQWRPGGTHCLVCGREVADQRSGKMPRHNRYKPRGRGYAPSDLCPGSGKTRDECNEIREQERTEWARAERARNSVF